MLRGAVEKPVMNLLVGVMDAKIAQDEICGVLEGLWERVGEGELEWDDCQGGPEDL